MRTVGRRVSPALSHDAQADSMVAAARFGESFAAFGTDTFVPKGVYRFRDHEAANKHQVDCIAKGLAARALRRG